METKPGKRATVHGGGTINVSTYVTPDQREEFHAMCREFPVKGAKQPRSESARLRDLMERWTADAQKRVAKRKAKTA